MKKYKLINLIGIFVFCAFSFGLLLACEDEENAVAHYEKNDVLIDNATDYNVEIWECILSDGIKITLEIYESENKYYSMLSDTTQIKILFKNNHWIDYQMHGDTMLIVKSGDIVIVPDNSSPKWKINKLSNNVMTMEYLGVLPAIPIQSMYEFNLK